MTQFDTTSWEDASLEELRAAEEKLSQAIARQLEARKREALDQIVRIATEHDLTYEEVIAGVRTTTKRGKAPALYRHPEKPRQTWCGKGEAPDWFKNHPDPEKLRIPDA